MRNPIHRLLLAAAFLLVPIGCQSPLRPSQTADLKPRKSLLGERFDENAAREKSRARQLRTENSEMVASAGSTQPPAETASQSAIEQAGFRRDAQAGQPASSQPATRSEQSQLPEAVAQHIREGSQAMARQDWANATTHYEAILSTDPRNPLAHQMLGRIGDQTQRFESAEYHYLRALSERPQDPNLLSDLGYSYLQQGRLPDAKRFLLKSLSIDANHQMAKANLAAVEAYSGNVDAALALLKQISSEQEAHQTLHELLNRPAPAQKRDQQLLSQQGENLSIGEQMRIARDSGRAERSRREALEALEMRQRVRQAMAVGGPLNKMGQGLADEEIGDIIAQLQNEDRQTGPPQQPQYPPQQPAAGPQQSVPQPYANPQQFANQQQFGAGSQYAAGPQSPAAQHFGGPAQTEPSYGMPQFGAPPQQPDLYGTQSQNQSPLPGQNPIAPYMQPQAPQFGAAASGPQNYGVPGPQQAPMHSRQQPGQYPPAGNQQANNYQANNYQPSNQQPGDSSQWNGAPPGFNPMQNFNPSRSELLPETQPQQQPLWRADPESYQNFSGPPAPQGQQQQVAPYGSAPANPNSYQSFPNGQQQSAPPGQFPTPPPSQPATGYDSNGQYHGGSQYGGGNSGFDSGYVPPSSPGVWSPQGARSSYETQTGAIQQLGYQTPAASPGPAANRQTQQNSMRQAMRLGMAAGPGSLIQMDGQTHQPSPQSRSASGTQQFAPAAAPQNANSPSSAVWNSGSNGSRIPSPNQNLWQTGPRPSERQNAAPPVNANSQQWQQLPSAQQQPQSSTWNHQTQRPTSPLQSQNWSEASSPGNGWQSNSFGNSPTLNDSFAPSYMLHPDPTQADTLPTMMTSSSQAGGSTTQNTAAQSHPGATRIPWTHR